MKLPLKKLFVLCLAMTGAESVFPQATFRFSNYFPVAGVDAPVFDAAGNRLSGPNYLAVLYGGFSSTSLSIASVGGLGDMAPVPFTFMADGQAGYFARGGYVQIDSVFCGETAWLQVRAWDARLGSSYEAVATLGVGGYGESNLFQKRGGDPCGGIPTPPEPLIGLQSFSLRAEVPEPGTWLLLLLSVPLFLVWRRRAT